MRWIILFLSLFTVGRSSRLAGDLILALRDHFHPIAVIFPVQNFHRLTRGMHISQLEMSLFGRGVMTAAVDVTLVDTVVARALYVILWNEDDTVQKLFSRLYPSDAYWLLFMDSDSASIDQALGTMDVPLNCEFLVAVQTTGSVKLNEVYRVHETSPLLILPWGNWSKESGLRAGDVLYERRSDFQGVNIVGLMTNFHPLTILDEETGNFTGFLPNLFFEVSRQLNFSPVAEKITAKGAGTLLPNGSWTGWMSVITTSPLNYSLLLLGLSGKRAAAVDFTMPTFHMKKDIYIKSSNESAQSWDTYVLPFEMTLWLAVMASMLIIACYITAMKHLLPPGDHLSSMDLLLRVWGTFCAQGLASLPHQASSRLVLWFSLVTGLIVVAAYGANFTSFLTLRKEALPFKDLNGLLRDVNYGFVLRPGGMSFKNFMNGEGVMQDLYVRKIKPNKKLLPLTDADDFNRICSGKFAVLIVRLDSRAALESVPCDVTRIPGYTETSVVAWSFPKRSPYRRIINHAILKMKRSGLYQRIFNVWLEAPAVLERNNLYRSVVVEDVPLPLLLCTGGCLISVTVLVLEICYYKKEKHPLGLFYRRPPESLTRRRYAALLTKVIGRSKRLDQAAQWNTMELLISDRWRQKAKNL